MSKIQPMQDSEYFGEFEYRRSAGFNQGIYGRKQRVWIRVEIFDRRQKCLVSFSPEPTTIDEFWAEVQRQCPERYEDIRAAWYDHERYLFSHATTTH